MATLRVRRLTLLALATALALATVAPAGARAAGPEPTVTATATTCDIDWGSTPKRAHVMRHTTASITNVRAGRHDCFDRMVIDLGPRTGPNKAKQKLGYRVRYVNKLTEIGTGDEVKVAGGARISISANAPAYDADGKPTYTPANRLKLVPVGKFSTFRQVAFLGSFEGQTLFGLGVRARLPMRAYVLEGPGKGSRLVIDVAHRW